jgi:hypothetical protein
MYANGADTLQSFTNKYPQLARTPRPGIRNKGEGISSKILPFRPVFRTLECLYRIFVRFLPEIKRFSRIWDSAECPLQV